MTTQWLRLFGNQNRALQLSFAEVVKKHSTPSISFSNQIAHHKETKQARHGSPTLRKIDLEFASPKSNWEWLTGTAHINGKLFTLSILEEHFGGNWKPSVPLNYNTSVVIQSSKEKESMSLANLTLKVSSSFSHVSISGEAEANGNKDCNDDKNTKVQENQKVGTDLLDQTGRSGDIVGTFNEALPHVEASTCEETQSPLVDGIIKAVEGS
ncbi:hypothetical protein Ancab_016918 [Ancistrocladus abbreviatus]